jgi:HEAT repeat protein/cyclophilin family peptidyl-prolyl cis-trans isomerase
MRKENHSLERHGARPLPAGSPRRLLAGSLALLLVSIPPGSRAADNAVVPRNSVYSKALQDEQGRNALLRIGILEDRRVPGSRELADYLEKDEPLIRLRAAQAIHRIGDRSQLPLLLRHIRDPDPGVSLECLFGIGQMGDSTAVPALRSVVTSGSPAQLAAAMEALGKIGDRRATPVLVQRLKHFTSPVRFRAALSLALMADSAAVDDLLLALQDDESSVVWAAAYALEKIPHKKAEEPLRRLLSHKDEMVRSYAARTLGRLKAGRAVEDLTGLLEDPSWKVAVRAAEALGRIGDRDATEALVGALASPNHHLRRTAADALGRLEDKDAAQALTVALRDPSPAVRSHAASALASTSKEEAIPHLRHLLDDTEVEVRAAAVYEIGRIGRDVDTSFVFRRLHDDPSPQIRAEAARSLGDRPAARNVPHLLRALEDRDWVVRAVAAEALGSIGDARAVGPLIEAYRSTRDPLEGDLPVSAVAAMKEIADSSAVDFLQDEALMAPDVRVRREAAEALESVTGRHVEPLDDAAWKRRTGWTPPETPNPFPPLGVHYARILTRHGEIRLELYGDEAPNTVGRFLVNASRGAYDDLTFHRVVPNFVVQGGDPRGDGWGDMGYRLRSEWNRQRYATGSLGVAHAGKDTGGSQFFITHSPQPHLNGRYTVFGRVIEGQPAVEAIQQGDRFRVVIDD